MQQSNALKNASWLLIEKGLLLGSGFIFTIFLTRYWTVSELGQYQYILALIGLLLPFSNLGLNSLVSKELVLREGDTDKILGTAILLRLIGAMLGGLVYAVLALWLVPIELQSLFWVLLLAQLTHAFGVFDYYFEAKVQSKVSAVIRTCVGLSFMLIKLFFVVNGMGITSILLITAIEWLVLGVMWFIVYQLYHQRVRHLTWCSTQARHYLCRCVWLILSSIAAVIYLKIDQVMLGNMDSNEAVAFYSLASRLSEVWYLVPGIIVASFYPALIRSKAKAKCYKNQLQSLCTYLCWGAVIIAVVMTLIAPPLVPWLFGEQYSSVIMILQIHIWASVFIFMRALFSKWILIEDIPKYSLLTHASGAVINIILNLWLIPQWGAIGAAWATLVSYAVASYIVLFCFVQTRPMAFVMTKALLAPLRYVYHVKQSPL
ncbi:flippase [Shewanella sp. UCD-KL12]|uniref:flippase n=1 Tax=Shewanella sp. UCD-KL12 TaxID=1917163 RepID=UPI0015C3CCB5|nr:flippase [Shewanella sp. UCD-KL12]